MLVASDHDLKMKNLLDGKCAAALDSVSEYRLAKEDDKLNPGCTLRSVGEFPLATFKGGWMVKSNDFGKKCTALLRDSLADLFLELEKDGQIADLEAKFYRGSMVEGCDENGNPDSKFSETDSFPIESMLGPIFIHLFGAILAFILYFRRKAKKESHPVANQIPNDACSDIRPLNGADASDISSLTAEIGALNAKLSHLFEKLS
ncbi:unnamed protein product [Prorocentrum cordatum]|uniref:Solute-binding protein family 3/N-terminal domain-containing protein n=1 Tax=Prorocentrum cordatum TaxID=2364126 RepID=A0ABN9PJF2_9DINO|nr:unnamed protein product [Polarella glacialis]